MIVGGGTVAAHKAKGLLEGGAGRVRCVAPEFVPVMPPEVERITATFEPSHLDGAALVFAATKSPEVNSDVVKAARERKIPVSRTDAEDDHGDFIVPANWRAGQIVVSVSTGSPTLSRSLRDEIQSSCKSIKQYQQMAELLARLRPWVLGSSLDPAQRVNALFDLATKPALDVVKQSGGEGLYRWLVEKYPELKLEKAP